MCECHEEKKCTNQEVFIYGEPEPCWFKELDKVVVHYGSVRVCDTYTNKCTPKRYYLGDVVRKSDLIEQL